MKRFLLAFLIFLIWAFFGLWFYSWLQKDGEPTVVSSEKTLQTSTPDSITDNSIALNTDKESKIDSVPPIAIKTGMEAKNEQGDIVFLFEEGIVSTSNRAKISVPASSVDFKYKISTYLIEHPDKEVQVISVYSPDENIEAPNLGIQRGNKVKQLLVKAGVASERILIKSVIKDVLFSEKGDFNNGISFSFKPWDKDRKDAFEGNLPESVTVYPKYSETGIIVNNNLRTLLEAVKIAVADNPEITIEVIGHTDNVGNAKDNYHMGLQYARQVRWYLISKGSFEKSLINATSKGETEPIDTNNSKRGRNANRRVEIVYVYNE